MRPLQHVKSGIIRAVTAATTGPKPGILQARSPAAPDAHLVGVGMMFVGMGCCGAAFVGLQTASETAAETAEMGYMALLLIGVAIVATTMILMVRKP